MNVLDLARWQFGITTVYHYFMVPLTLGLGALVVVMHTMWVRTGRAEWLRMTRFWGRIYLINFALGVATGLVQEFQFGLAWSAYSRLVGDVFGSLLAMEALLAFFLESTFLGLWIFGWGRIPKKLHLATLWVAVVGSWISAYFIIAANSWMQHPVGVVVDNTSGSPRPRQVDIWAVLTNNIAIAAYSHTIVAALTVAGSLLVGIGLWQLRRRSLAGKGVGEVDQQVWRRSVRLGLDCPRRVRRRCPHRGLVGQADVRTTAAEDELGRGVVRDDGPRPVLGVRGRQAQQQLLRRRALLHRPRPAQLPHPQRLLQRGAGRQPAAAAVLPGLRATYPDDPSFGDLAGKRIDYTPVLAATYWGFRLMIGMGILAAAVAAYALWATRRGRVPRSRIAVYGALAAVGAPFLANAAGWIFTEMGRQPFVVYPDPDVPVGQQVYFFTAQAVSPGVSAGEVLTSVITLTALYGVLAIIEVGLIVRFVRAGITTDDHAPVTSRRRDDPGGPDDEHPDDQHPDDKHDASDGVLSFAY